VARTADPLRVKEWACPSVLCPRLAADSGVAPLAGAIDLGMPAEIPGSKMSRIQARDRQKTDATYRHLSHCGWAS
jgi:hypothetical protein